MHPPKTRPLSWFHCHCHARSSTPEARWSPPPPSLAGLPTSCPPAPLPPPWGGRSDSGGGCDAIVAAPPSAGVLPAVVAGRLGVGSTAAPSWNRGRKLGEGAGRPLLGSRSGSRVAGRGGGGRDPYQKLLKQVSLFRSCMLCVQGSAQKQDVAGPPRRGTKNPADRFWIALDDTDGLIEGLFFLCCAYDWPYIFRYT